MLLKKLEKAWLLILILEFALFLRAYGMSFSYIYEADAHVYVDRAVRFLQTGDWNPHWFGNPASILMYLLAALYALYFMIGKSFGFFNDMEGFTHYLMVNPTYSYLTGRALIVFFGTLSTLVTYKIGKKIFDKKVGLIAAFLFAVIPIHVASSKVIRTDVMATFFILLSFLYCIHILEEDNFRGYIMAGVFAGLAAATRYPAVLVILMIVIARLIKKRRTLFKESMDYGKSAPILEGWMLFILGMWLTIFGMRFFYAFIPATIPIRFPLDLTHRFLLLFKITPKAVVVLGISLVITSLVQGRFVGAFRNFLRNSLLNTKVVLASVVGMSCFFYGNTFFPFRSVDRV